MHKKSMLLVKDEPILFSPKLAKEIGLNEAIILQQVHYWTEINKSNNVNFYDGYYWTFNSYSSWQKNHFPFWSEKTIERIFHNLEENSFLLVGNYNKKKYDKTKWYRVNHEKINSLNIKPSRQNDSMHTDKLSISSCQNDVSMESNCRDAYRQNDVMDKDKLTSPIPETNKENNKETNNNNNNVVSLFDEILKISKTYDNFPLTNKLLDKWINKFGEIKVYKYICDYGNLTDEIINPIGYLYKAMDEDWDLSDNDYELVLPDVSAVYEKMQAEKNNHNNSYPRCKCGNITDNLVNGLCRDCRNTETINKNIDNKIIKCRKCGNKVDKSETRYGYCWGKCYEELIVNESELGKCPICNFQPCICSLPF